MWWRAYTLFESLLLVDINTITGPFYFYLFLLHPKKLILSSSVFPLFCPSFIMTCSASSLIMYLSFFSVFWYFSCICPCFFRVLVVFRYLSFFVLQRRLFFRICPCCFTLDKKSGTWIRYEWQSINSRHFYSNWVLYKKVKSAVYKQ